MAQLGLFGDPPPVDAAAAPKLSATGKARPPAAQREAATEVGPPRHPQTGPADGVPPPPPPERRRDLPDTPLHMHSTLVVPPCAPLQCDEAMLAKIEALERAEAAAVEPAAVEPAAVEPA